MDVEMVQKVNKLAVDLLNQGMVTSRLEAVKKAEELLSRDGSHELSDMSRQEAPVQAEVVVEQAPAIKEQESGPGLDELRQIVLKNNEFIVNNLRELKSSLSSLKEELSSLKQDVSEVKSRPVVQPQVQQQPTLTNLYEQAAIAKPAPQEKAEESHPKQGQYNSEDVSIEKFFYMGNK